MRACAFDRFPAVQARPKPLLAIDGLTFKGLNANGKLDAYEDWRRPVGLSY